MVIMADILIKAVYDIKAILDDKKLFKKSRIRGIIKQLTKKLYELRDKSSFSAADIVNFCLLVDTARLLDLCNSKIITADTIANISVIKGAEKSRWPVIGTITVSPNNLRTITYNAHMDSDIDLDGQIDLSWIILSIRPINIGGERSRVITYNASVKDLTSEPPKNMSANIVELTNMSYRILPNVFTLFIESILDGLKRRYLK